MHRAADTISIKKYTKAAVTPVSSTDFAAAKATWTDDGRASAPMIWMPLSTWAKWPPYIGSWPTSCKSVPHKYFSLPKWKYGHLLMARTSPCWAVISAARKRPERTWYSVISAGLAPPLRHDMYASMPYKGRSNSYLRMKSSYNNTHPVFMKQNKKRIRVKLHAFFVFLFFSSPPILRIFAPKKKRWRYSKK